MNHDVLDALYATRRELTRLIVATSGETVASSQLVELLQKRDKVVWMINRILVGNLTASLADVDKAADAIESSTQDLKALTATAEHLNKAIGIANDVLSAAVGLLGAA